MEEIFQADSNLRSADAELQQRASEYLALSKLTSLDVLATVLEEMPPFPERESSGTDNLQLLFSCGLYCSLYRNSRHYCEQGC